MDNYSKIYWLTRLDNIQVFFTILLVLGITIFTICHIVMYVDCYDNESVEDYNRSYKKYKITSIWVSIVSAFVLVFLPTKNDMILIYAGGKTMNYVQSDTSLAKIPYQTTSIISEYLDKSIKELRDE